VTTHPTSGGPSGHDIRALRGLFDGESYALWRIPDAVWRPVVDPPPRGVLSGAFNPRHSGHDGLRVAAEAWIAGPVHFELPLMNADKPALQIDAAVERCRQFHDGPLLVSRAATFVEKARILPGTTFVVGVDTAVRIVAHRFYGPADDPLRAEAAMFESLEEFRGLGCRFLVAARMWQGQTLRLPDVSIPDRLQDLFVELPATRFLLDVSSSGLRHNASGAQR
jgi:hypothetical protein